MLPRSNNSRQCINNPAGHTAIPVSRQSAAETNKRRPRLSIRMRQLRHSLYGYTADFRGPFRGGEIFQYLIDQIRISLYISLNKCRIIKPIAMNDVHHAQCQCPPVRARLHIYTFMSLTEGICLMRINNPYTSTVLLRHVHIVQNMNVRSRRINAPTI